MHTLLYNHFHLHFNANILQFFKLNVYNEAEEICEDSEILSALLKIVQMSPCPTEPVGILTTENRNAWGSTYLQLKKGNVLLVIFIFCLIILYKSELLKD